MVETWWDAWWMWSFSTILFVVEKYANFLRFIFGKAAALLNLHSTAFDGTCRTQYLH
jgi:hypothetical protein